MQGSEKTAQLANRDGGPDSFSRSLMSCAMMLICAGLLLIAMRWFATAAPGELPAAPPPGVPDRRLRFVSCDVQGRELHSEPVLGEIEKLTPDFLILQHARESDVRAVGGALHLQIAFLVPTQRTTSLSEPLGSAVLAKSAISVVGSLGSLGFWTSSTIGPNTISIASVASSGSGSADAVGGLVSQWKDRGAPPIVVAGPFPAVLQPDDLVQATSGWFDGLSPWLRVVPETSAAELRPRIFLSPGWSCAGGGLIAGYALTPVWIDAGSSAFVTKPATPPAALGEDD